LEGLWCVQKKKKESHKITIVVGSTIHISMKGDNTGIGVWKQQQEKSYPDKNYKGIWPFQGINAENNFQKKIKKK